MCEKSFEGWDDLFKIMLRMGQCTSNPGMQEYFLSVMIQLTFTCSKKTIETLKKGMKYVQS